MTLEYRAAAEVASTQGRTLVGYAATWAGIAKLPGFTERVAKGAFSASLASGADVRALVDHDETKLLGRTSSGTLNLTEDKRGLAYSISLPSTQLADDLLELVKRSDVRSVSFGFRVNPQGETWNAMRSERTLLSVMLGEISLLHGTPAYNSTSIEARSRAEGFDAHRLRARFLETIL